MKESSIDRRPFIVVMAPLTRDRSPEHIPDDFVDEYYAQRASDGGLLISEATHISVMVFTIPITGALKVVQR